MNEKQCTRCKKLKPYSKFYADKKHKDGLASACKTCVKTIAAKSKAKKIIAKEPVNAKALEILEKLARIRLCEAEICPSCKQKNIINAPEGFICGWCRAEYDFSGKMIGE